MNSDLTEAQILQLITTIVNRHGCQIRELDLQNSIINIDGPPQARVECAQELEAFLG